MKNNRTCPRCDTKLGIYRKWKTGRLNPTKCQCGVEVYSKQDSFRGLEAVLVTFGLFGFTIRYGKIGLLLTLFLLVLLELIAFLFIPLEIKDTKS